MAKIIDPRSHLDEAVALLKKGEVVGMPTETVYGLAGDVFNETAIQKIFAVKKRPFFDPLIVHVGTPEDVHKLVESVPKVAEVLMQNFWPGPLTLILPKKKSVSDLVTSGLETVGVRMPDHKVALELIRQTGSPLAAPSANLFGRTSPTTAAHVASEFGNDVAVIDGGPSQIGLESTVVGFSLRDSDSGEVCIYRPGGVTADMIRVVLLRNKLNIEVVMKESNVAPGHLQHHYMPKIPLVLVPPNTDPQSLAVSLCDQLELKIWRPVKLELSHEPALAARELYAKLRECGEGGASVILIERDPQCSGDLWDAIWNRLEKAATLRLAQ